MGLTLVAILTAALLLPGIIAAQAFYFAGQTREVEVPVPSLSTPAGIALVGGFSTLVHATYVLCLKVVSTFPTQVPLPLANPYRIFFNITTVSSLDVTWSLFSGLIMLGLVAGSIGLLVGHATMRWGDRSTFYGPLSEVIRKADGDDKFITAYVVTKIEAAERLIGYEGTVESLFRDADGFPAKVVLTDVVPFYLEHGKEGPVRTETDQFIDLLVLRSDDWHNIAFRVFQLIDEDSPESV